MPLCKYCKQTYEMTAANRLFCSKDCRDKQSASVRRYGGRHFQVLERDNFTCQICESKDDIVVHHRDHNIENNHLQNLITWCRRCHTSYHQSVENNNLYKHITKDRIEKAITLTSTLEEAAKVLGITRKTLMKKRLEYGFPHLSNGRKGVENKTYKALSANEILMAFELTGNWSKAAERLSVSSSFLRKRRNELGMEMDVNKCNKEKPSNLLR